MRCTFMQHNLNIGHLARNPGVWTRLQAEITALGDADLTFSTLKSLKYLQHCFKECTSLPHPTDAFHH